MSFYHMCLDSLLLCEKPRGKNIKSVMMDGITGDFFDMFPGGKNFHSDGRIHYVYIPQCSTKVESDGVASFEHSDVFTTHVLPALQELLEETNIINLSMTIKDDNNVTKHIRYTSQGIIEIGNKRYDVSYHNIDIF